MRHVLKTDGGSRGNPGPAGAGFVLVAPDGTVVRHGGRFLGTATNNVAEYEALVWGLRNALEAGVRRLRVQMDSELIVRQLQGVYKVKNQGLKGLHAQARHLLSSFAEVEFVHVPREENRDADALANEAMDTRAPVGNATQPTAAEQDSLFE